MKLFSVLLVLSSMSGILFSQSIPDLYYLEDFAAISKLNVPIDSMTSEECFMSGYAFYRLDEDMKAIEYYNAAIDKGYNKSDVYLYRGLSYRYANDLEKSLKDIQIGVDSNPNRQRYLFELGIAYLYLERIDEALSTLKLAREKDYELGDPYYYYPYIFQYQEKYAEALEEYKISAKLIDKSDPYYVDILKETGVLEYSLSKDFNAAREAYEEAISIVDDTTGFKLYSKLIKCYNGLEEYSTADSLWTKMKQAFDDKKLPYELMEEGQVAIDEFTWNDRRIISFKTFVNPEELLDEIYRAYLLNEEGDGIDTKFMTEKTFSIGGDAPTHLFCSRIKDETHFTYPIGWESDNIDYKSFKKFVLDALDKKLEPSASSKIRN